METMSNEQKAKEIVEEKMQIFEDYGYDPRRTAGIINQACISMAEWKDKQFAEIINGLPQGIKDLLEALAR